MDARAEQEQALCEGRGAVWLPRDVWLVAGPDALSFLQGQLSQDVAALVVGGSALSFVLEPTGRVAALCRVVRTGDDELLLDTDGGFGDALGARLARFRLRVKADLVPLSDWRCLRLVAAADVAAADVVVPTGWPTLAGMDVLGPTPQVPAGFVVCDAEAYEAVRIQAGVPVMGAELTERTIPAEVDILDLTVSFTKGCYTGQELVARIDSRGGHVPRHLRRLVVDAGPVPPPGAAIEMDGANVGTVTSSAPSALLRAPVALGYVHRDVPVPARVTLRWADGESAATVAPRE